MIHAVILMKNLSHILNAAKHPGGFELGTFQLMLNEIQRDTGGEFSWDWDPGVPENWASGWVNGERLVLMWRGGRFAFVDDRAPEALVQAFTSRGITTERVANWDDEIYCLIRETVDDLFGLSFPHDEIDVKAVSIQDLWWATVT